MAIIGYGEDGLTFRAMHTDLAALLAALDDETPAEECDVFFRPSFGRAGGPQSPQFGEFDSILVTKTHVYPIESKWDNFGRPAPNVVLKEVQILRHKIFQWLYDRWHAEFGGHIERSWDTFVTNSSEDFTRTFPNRPLAPAGSLLARNLTYILERLNQPHRIVKNLVLYFHQDQHDPPHAVLTVTGEPAGFQLVPRPYIGIEDSAYIDMNQ